MMLRRGCLALIVLGACSSSSNPKTPDASGSGTPDATPATVQVVDCASVTPKAIVTDPGFLYSSAPAGSAGNDSAVNVGDAVEFNLVPQAFHPVGPDAASGMTDPGLVAPDNKVTCLKFTAAGTFHYKCTIHGFKGTVTVGP